MKSKENILSRKAFLVIVGFFLYSNSLIAENQKKADSLKELYQQNTFTLIDEYEILRNISHWETNPLTAIDYSTKLIKLSTTNNNPLWLMRGHLQKGNALRRQGKLDAAIAAYFKSAEAAKHAKYPAGIGGAYLSIGDVFGDQGDFKNSISYANQAIDLLRSTTDAITLATALLNTGYSYYTIEEFDSALNYYKESAQIFEIKNHHIGKAYNLGNTGLVYAKQGQNQKAETQLTKAIRILAELEDSYAITEFQIEIADILMQKGQYLEAEKYLTEALEYAYQDGLQERIRDASLKLSELYDTKQSYKKAYVYHKQYVTYRDTINNEQTIRDMADLRTEYEVGQKQVELDLEEAKVGILEEKAFYAEVRFWTLSAAALILLCIFAIGLRLYRSRMIALRLADSRFGIINDQRKQLDKMNRLKDQFFSIISHDLRGPMGNLAGVTYLIKMNLDRKDYEGLYEINDMLKESSEEISSLLENLLNWAVAQQQQVSYDFKETSVEDVCNPSLRVLQPTAKKKKITMTDEVRSDLMLLADINTVTTVVRNLLSNALKFTKEGGEVDLIISQEADMAVISVKDNGIGIPTDKIESLFTFTGKRKRWGTGGEKGVGLGLNLVQEFVSKNNGRVEVISLENEGSEFKVFLPLFDGEST